jgi:hypothetical protein
VTLFNHQDTSWLGTIPNGINNNGVDTPGFAPANLESSGSGPTSSIPTTVPRPHFS